MSGILLKSDSRTKRKTECNSLVSGVLQFDCQTSFCDEAILNASFVIVFLPSDAFYDGIQFDVK